MSEEIWARREIDSPCVKLCVVHPEARICIGCNRTIDEISGWSTLSSDARRAIMQDLPSRSALLTKRRGGRSARMER